MMGRAEIRWWPIKKEGRVSRPGSMKKKRFYMKKVIALYWL
ncbi:hypothetical protein PMF13cell1_04488 [Blautia producta]|uniref:Uncharacterized protein n=1 Tax=Blautia producta TaxID=33035 RepID=A0A4P6M2L4_9FIRM|nr:hypothetical protein PMF13cell1_04488 [Blautia producta]